MRFKAFIEGIDNSLKKIPQLTDNFSALMSKLASYSVANGLIYFFASRAHCKYPMREALIDNTSSIIIAILFAIFSLDTLANHSPIKIIIDKNIPRYVRIIVYSFCLIVGVLLSWLYLAGIYYPLFTLPQTCSY
ncbi:hypothetical protein [Xenorhabdus bovienii]|uniref:hypothetical protein n=1 Tax=Xenorhabdus bovienii TaxID=40576 RepID=UPI000571394B|nr:hypothetical protein [Xenorhabdus bovienii]MDE9553296.1 hypothetical protein [Xenorhabdus bovienii]